MMGLGWGVGLARVCKFSGEHKHVASVPQAHQSFYWEWFRVVAGWRHIGKSSPLGSALGSDMLA